MAVFTAGVDGPEFVTNVFLESRVPSRESGAMLALHGWLIGWIIIIFFGTIDVTVTHPKKTRSQPRLHTIWITVRDIVAYF